MAADWGDPLVIQHSLGSACYGHQRVSSTFQRAREPFEAPGAGSRLITADGNCFYCSTLSGHWGRKKNSALRHICRSGIQFLQYTHAQEGEGNPQRLPTCGFHNWSCHSTNQSRFSLSDDFVKCWKVLDRSQQTSRPFPFPLLCVLSEQS